MSKVLVRVWAAVFHHVTARSRLARFETYVPVIYFILQFFFGPRLTAGTESVDTGARLHTSKRRCCLWGLYSVMLK
jgi:hypothetical protein